MAELEQDFLYEGVAKEVWITIFERKDKQLKTVFHDGEWWQAKAMADA